MMNDGALVLFSGGQDSTTCLAWALQAFARVETVGFDYGQRHRVELDVRDQLRETMRGLNPHWQHRLFDDHLIDLGSLGEVSNTSLTRDVAFAMGQEGLPNSFVPGRNLIFLTFAAAVAYRRGLKHIITGVCETDFSGYPDCRDDTIKAMQIALNLGMERRFVIHTPLMWIDKAQTWQMAHDLGGQALVDVMRNDTHTCYIGDRTHFHAWGYGCNACPACDLRRQGYEKWCAEVSLTSASTPNNPDQE
jgi:7-cyano-7-deazaguanine synthase